MVQTKTSQATTSQGGCYSQPTTMLHGVLLVDTNDAAWRFQALKDYNKDYGQDLEVQPRLTEIHVRCLSAMLKSATASKSFEALKSVIQTLGDTGQNKANVEVFSEYGTYKDVAQALDDVFQLDDAQEAFEDEEEQKMELLVALGEMVQASQVKYLTYEPLFDTYLGIALTEMTEDTLLASRVLQNLFHIVIQKTERKKVLRLLQGDRGIMKNLRDIAHNFLDAGNFELQREVVSLLWALGRAKRRNDDLTGSDLNALLESLPQPDCDLSFSKLLEQSKLPSQQIRDYCEAVNQQRTSNPLFFIPLSSVCLTVSTADENFDDIELQGPENLVSLGRTSMSCRVVAEQSAEHAVLHLCYHDILQISPNTRDRSAHIKLKSTKVLNETLQLCDIDLDTADVTVGLVFKIRSKADFASFWGVITEQGMLKHVAMPPEEKGEAEAGVKSVLDMSAAELKEQSKGGRSKTPANQKQQKPTQAMISPLDSFASQSNGNGKCSIASTLSLQLSQKKRDARDSFPIYADDVDKHVNETDEVENDDAAVQGELRAMHEEVRASQEEVQEVRGRRAAPRGKGRKSQSQPESNQTSEPAAQKKKDAAAKRKQAAQLKKQQTAEKRMATRRSKSQSREQEPEQQVAACSPSQSSKPLQSPGARALRCSPRRDSNVPQAQEREDEQEEKEEKEEKEEQEEQKQEEAEKPRSVRRSTRLSPSQVAQKPLARVRQKLSYPSSADGDEDENQDQDQDQDKDDGVEVAAKAVKKAKASSGNAKPKPKPKPKFKLKTATRKSKGKPVGDKRIADDVFNFESGDDAEADKQGEFKFDDDDDEEEEEEEEDVVETAAASKKRKAREAAAAKKEAAAAKQDAAAAKKEAAAAKQDAAVAKKEAAAAKQDAAAAKQDAAAAKKEAAAAKKEAARKKREKDAVDKKAAAASKRDQLKQEKKDAAAQAATRKPGARTPGRPGHGHGRRQQQTTRFARDVEDDESDNSSCEGEGEGESEDEAEGECEAEEPVEVKEDDRFTSPTTRQSARTRSRQVNYAEVPTSQDQENEEEDASDFELTQEKRVRSPEAHSDKTRKRQKAAPASPSDLASTGHEDSDVQEEVYDHDHNQDMGDNESDVDSDEWEYEEVEVEVTDDDDTDDNDDDDNDNDDGGSSSAQVSLFSRGPGSASGSGSGGGSGHGEDAILWEQLKQVVQKLKVREQEKKLRESRAYSDAVAVRFQKKVTDSLKNILHKAGPSASEHAKVEQSLCALAKTMKQLQDCRGEYKRKMAAKTREVQATVKQFDAIQKKVAGVKRAWGKAKEQATSHVNKVKKQKLAELQEKLHSLTSQSSTFSAMKQIMSAGVLEQ